MKKIKDMSKAQEKIDSKKVAKVLGAKELKNSWLKRFLSSLRKRARK